LLKRHKSRPYNPKVANVFYRAGYIEAWGRGIERITLACEDAGKPKPLFETSAGDVSVTFFTGGVEDFVETEVHRAIKKLMREQPTISAKMIAKKIGMTSRGVQKNIDALKRAGLIERVGSAKLGHWIVKGVAE